VLVLVSQGRTNREIGENLFISEKTASVHVSNILAKLGVANRAEAGAKARTLGLDRLQIRMFGARLRPPICARCEPQWRYARIR
jgi:Bacterial regulatory proteins, luxR family